MNSSALFRVRRGLLFLCILGVQVSCSALGTVKFESRDLTIACSSGASVLMTVEIARDQAQRTQGLMYRKSLDDGKGMLFIFEKDQVLSFWMKNTAVPLSIAYISSNGKILEIQDMEPFSTRSVHSKRSVRYALEVPLGWFSRAGISTGDSLILE